jgi:predicted transposase/invertase (TIGR01784 family)
MNLEMQVINEHDWTDRSLNYLCRNYTKLIKGDNYFLAKPVIQIGFLNFDLFPKEPEFYATYRMENIKTHSLYSSKLQIGVVELNRIDIATDEDEAYKIDQWAKLFKMKDWKGLKAMVKDNKYLEEAAKTIYYLNSDEHIQAVCERRAEVEAEERRQKKIEADYETIKIDFNNIKAENSNIKAENNNIKAENSTIKAENSSIKSKYSSIKNEYSNIKAENLKQSKEIEELKEKLAALNK